MQAQQADTGQKQSALCSTQSGSLLMQLACDVPSSAHRPFIRTATSERGPGAQPGLTSLCMQVARMSDFGSNDRTLLARTHLGAVLHAGDTALGYDLASSNITDPELEQAVAKGLTLPDVVLVSFRLPLLARTRLQQGLCSKSRGFAP